MSYARMDHAEIVESHYRATRRLAERPGATKRQKTKAAKFPEKLTDFQAKVMDILGMVGGGIYNAPLDMDKIDWDYGYNGVSVLWHRDMATFDFHQLTTLVFLCHEARIRVDISPATFRQVRLSFWQRGHEGDMTRRHPNLDEAVAAFRAWLPADHRIRYIRCPPV